MQKVCPIEHWVQNQNPWSKPTLQWRFAVLLTQKTKILSHNLVLSIRYSFIFLLCAFSGSYKRNEVEGIIRNTILDIGASYKSSSNEYVASKIYDRLQEEDAMNQYYVAVIVYDPVGGYNQHEIDSSCSVHVFREKIGIGRNYVVFYRRQDSTSSNVSIYCPKWSTTPITAMGRRYCLSFSII